MLFDFLRKKDDIIKDPVTPSTREPDVDGAGFMVVEDVFSIKGRGTIVTGRIEEGSFHIGDAVAIRKADGTVIDTKILAIEAFHKSIDMAIAGDNVGLLLEDVDRNQIEYGDEISSV